MRGSLVRVNLTFAPTKLPTLVGAKGVELQVKAEWKGAELHTAILQYVVVGVLQVEGNAEDAETEHPVDGDGTLADVLLHPFYIVAKHRVLRLDAAIDVEVDDGAEAYPEVVVEAILVG